MLSIEYIVRQGVILRQLGCHSIRTMRGMSSIITRTVKIYSRKQMKISLPSEIKVIQAYQETGSLELQVIRGYDYLDFQYPLKSDERNLPGPVLRDPSHPERADNNVRARRVAGTSSGTFQSALLPFSQKMFSMATYVRPGPW
jgi:hypothetical protein